MSSSDRHTPQLEDGYVRFATEWLEEFLAWSGPARVKDFVWVVARETWGWNSTWREVPMSRIAQLLQCSRGHAKQLRQEALRHNLVECRAGKGTGELASYRVQKDPLEWIDYNSPKSRRGTFPTPGQTDMTGSDGYDRVNPVIPGQESVPGTGSDPSDRDPVTPVCPHCIDSEKQSTDSNDLLSETSPNDGANSDNPDPEAKPEPEHKPDPAEEKKRVKHEKAMRDAERLRKQTEELEEALAGLAETDRDILDRMLAGQQLDPKRAGRPLTLLQQRDQARLYAKELAEHGLDCWRDCCEVAISKQIYTAEYARGCTANWKPRAFPSARPSPLGTEPEQDRSKFAMPQLIPPGDDDDPFNRPRTPAEAIARRLAAERTDG